MSLLSCFTGCSRTLTSSDFRAVQSRHEKARRRHADGDFGSISSAHHSSPSQTYATGHNHATSKASSTLRRKFGSGSGSGPGTRERQSSVDGGVAGPKTSLSPMNPRRNHPSGSGSGGLLSPGVSIGGAVASMNSSAGLGTMRPGSPPSSNLAARRRLLGGMRKGAAQGHA